MFGITNPWVYLGAFMLLVGVGLGGYFYGHNEGVNSEKAALADSYQTALNGVVKAAGDAAKSGTAAALKDFQDKTKVLSDLAAQLQTAQETANAAASNLARSFKAGSCVLQPAQRRLLECVRRPSDSGCGQPTAGH